MKLFFRQFGEGPPLVILHGLYGMSDNWVSVANRLAVNFTVFLPDLRNHGHSPHSLTHNYPSMAEDIREFIGEKVLSAPVVLGHSMGGKVAMTLALDSPGMISRLIIVDIAPKNYPLLNLHLDVLRAMQSVDFKLIAGRQDVEKVIHDQISDPRIRLFIQKNLFRREHNTFGWRANLSAISENMDFLAGIPELQGVFDKPALFVRGGKSDYILDSDFPLIQRLFPAARILTIAEAGHWVHADAADKLCEILLEFALT